MSKPPTLHVVDPDPDDPGLNRAAPHNIQAEQVVLGAVMLSPVALTEVRALLDGSEFYRAAHQRIWEAICALANDGAPHDPLAVGAELGRDLSKAGGAPYLHTLIARVPTAANATYYAHMLRDLAYARSVVETGFRLVQRGQAAAEMGDIASLRSGVAAELTPLTAPDTRGWSDPAPLSVKSSLPPFPIWALPDWLAEYTAAVAEVTQTPADLAGCLSLAVLAVAAGGKVWVQAPAWVEPTNIYTVIVLPPGSRKSEVYAKMTAPIREAEKQLVASARPWIEERRIAYRIAEANAEEAIKAAESASDSARRDELLGAANAAAIELADVAIPAEPVLYSSNATGEKLTSLMAAQGGRFAVLAPEGKIFSILAGRYSGVPDLEVFLSGHAGEEMRIDRIGRPSERIDAATLTLGVCVQPGVLARLGDTPEFREQGLLGRLLFSLPDPMLGYRNPTPDPIPDHVSQTYVANLTSLVLSLNSVGDSELNVVSYGSGGSDTTVDPREVPSRATLRFTDEANSAVIAMLADVEPRLRPGSDLAHMTDWGGKLVGATVRIAALLHIAHHFRDGWARPIDADTFDAAREIGEYFTAHAQAAYDAIGADAAVASARALLEWIRRTHTTRFAARDVLAALRARFTKIGDLGPALAILEAHGWIRTIPAPPQTGRGRKASPSFEVHPAAMETSR
jgi:replicative DNA helicase